MSSSARVALMWLIQAQFAGYVLAKRGLPELTLVPRDLASSPLEALAKGAADFGVASPDQLLSSPELARDLVFVGLFMDRCPIVLVGIKGRAPDNLGDIGRCRIGIWPGEDTEVRAMVLAAGGNLQAATFVPLGADLAPLLDGDLDLMEATTYNEVPHLQERLGIDSLVIHRPVDWGVDLAKDGLVVKTAVLRDNPDLVDSVVAAVVRGWAEAIANPEAAVAAVLQADPSLEAAGQRKQLQLILQLIDPARPLGRPEAGAIERAAMVHRRLGRSASAADVTLDSGPWERGRLV